MPERALAVVCVFVDNFVVRRLLLFVKTALKIRFRAQKSPLAQTKGEIGQLQIMICAQTAAFVVFVHRRHRVACEIDKNAEKVGLEKPDF